MRGNPVDDGPLQALAAMGAAPELLEEARQCLEERKQEFAVWPENWLPVKVLGAMATQWRIAGLGGIVGLDYGVLPWVMEMVGVSDPERPAVFADLRILESTVLPEMNKRP